MEAEPLFAACELAFAVAREGEKSVPPIEPPPAMRNYLYVAQLPRRAITVAQRAIDDDPTFRRRVAADATEKGVGREGFLWLTRPQGWDSELTAAMGMAPSAGGNMAAQVPPEVPAAPLVTNTPIPPKPVPPKPAPLPSGTAQAGSPQQSGVTQTPSIPPLPVPAPPAVAPGASNPASSGSIEDELANLRGLVDELSAERIDPVDGVLPTVEVSKQAQPSPAHVSAAVNDSAAEAQEAELATARARLTELESELRAARQAAAAQLSDAAMSSEAAVAAAVKATEVSARKEAERVAAEAVVSSDAAIVTAVAAAEVSAREEAQRIAVQTVQSSEAAATAAVEAEKALATKAIQSSEAAATAAVEAEKARSAEAVQSSEAAATAAVEEEKVSARTEAERVAAEATVSSQAAVLTAVEAEKVSARTEAERVAAEAAVFSEAAVSAAIEAEKASALEAVTIAEASAAKASADDKVRLDELVAERDDLARELSDLRHEQTLLVGAASERDLVRESLDTANTEHEDLVRQLQVAEQARVDLEGELSQLSRQWQDFQVELEDVRNSMAGTRSVFEDSMRTMSDGLSKTEDALAGSAPESTSVDPKPSSLTADDSASVPVEAAAVEAAPVEAAPVEVAPVEAVPVEVVEEAVVPAKVEALSDEAVEVVAPKNAETDAQAAPDIESSDLTEVLDTYGLGSNSVPQTIEQPNSDTDPQVAVPSSDEPSPVDDSAIAEPEVDPVDVKVPSKSDSERRFEIQIPASISMDPLAVIRHVVATDDVVVLVDGDAVSEMGWPETAVATRREALVKYLGDLAADTGAAQDAVFSGSLSEGDDLPVSRAVRVRITAPGIAPSDALAELVDSYPREWPIAVVSDDSGLAEYASAKGATLLSNGQLLDLLFDRWEASQGE